jgi:hypothetical protein
LRFLRLLLRPALTLVSLSAAFLLGYVGLLHARPYDAPFSDEYQAEIRAFLHPDSCNPPTRTRTPCLLNLRPGETTLEEALTILNHHAWVAGLEAYGDDSQFIYWSGAQPDFIDASEPGMVVIENGIVNKLRIPTQIRFGDLWLLMGQPQRGGFLYVRDRPIAHFAQYSRHLMARIAMQCPASLSRLWDEPSLMIVGPVYVVVFEDYNALRRERRLTC